MSLGEVHAAAVKLPTALARGHFALLVRRGVLLDNVIAAMGLNVQPTSSKLQFDFLIESSTV